jgi:hypothetical protein
VNMNMKQALFISAITAHLLSIVFPHPIITWIVSLLCLGIVVIVYISAKRLVRIFGSVFLGAGIFLLYGSGLEWEDFILSFGTMLNILSLFALIPIIALPIELGNYAVRVRTLIQKKVRDSGQLYIVTSFLSYILSSFIGLATLPMVHQSIRPSLALFRIQENNRFMCRAITHGYAMPIIWTPVAPIVGIIIEMTGVSWSQILPFVIPLSLLGLALDWAMGTWLANRRQRTAAAVVQDEDESNLGKSEAAFASESIAAYNQTYHPIHILIAIIAFNIAVYFMEIHLKFGFLFLVSVAVIPFGYVWSLFIGKGKLFITKSRATFLSHVMKMQDQFFIFLCAGFFISTIRITGSGDKLNYWIMGFKDMIGTEVFIFMIPLIPLGLAFIGLHPAVGLALTAQSLNPQLLGISPELTAIAMLTGAATAFMMGPYNATLGIMATLVNQSPYRLSNWNAPFTFGYLFIVLLFMMVVK